MAGFGALHGLNPSTGWMLAASWGVRSGDRRQALWALVPIALGHTVAVAMVVAAVAWGLSLERSLQQMLAGSMLAVVAAIHWHGRKARRMAIVTGHAGLVLCSFLAATVHGAGMLLVPALMPLCLGGASAQQIGAAGSLWMALAMVGVHTGAMLAVTGALACIACKGASAGAAWIRTCRDRLART